MSTKETKTDGKYNINFGWVLFIPVIVLLGIVPLVTRLAVINVDEATYKVFGSPQIFDFFSQNKSALIIGMAAIILFVLFLAFDKKKIKLDNTMKGYYILIGIYILFSAISTMMSDYQDIAMWGIADRSEGMIVLGAYVIIMLYTIYLMNTGQDYKYIILPLCFLVIITGILGYFQYIGEDLFMTKEWGQKLIIPEKYAEARAGLTSQFTSERIYGTMYHYNYMGSFGAMMVPLFLTLTLFLKGYKNKIAFGIITVISAFLLFGSTSRAGLIGLVCSLVIFIIVFSKKIIKNYKFTLPVLVAAIVLIVGLDVATKGAIFERIPTLVNDAIGLFLPSDKEFDYKSQIPVRDIYTEGNTIVIQTQVDKLIVEPVEEGLEFEDSAGNGVEFILGESDYTTVDSRFNGFSFSKQTIGEEIKQDYIVINYNGRALLVAEVNTLAGARLVDRITLEPTEIQYPEAIGFKGKEKLGSARGYIWSRSLPMLKDTLLIGNGPDTYAIEFPQGDIFGKWYAYDTPNMVVDKPHNMYLQIGINQGGIALLAFLGFIGLYIIQSLRLYTFKGVYQNIEIIGVAYFVAVIGYLGAGVFNDSIVSVAPIFWILLGGGIATNYMIVKEKRRQEKIMEHATISMNNRKHI